MVTPKADKETTAIVSAHIKQRDLVAASILAVPDKNSRTVGGS